MVNADHIQQRVTSHSGQTLCQGLDESFLHKTHSSFIQQGASCTLLGGVDDPPGKCTRLQSSTHGSPGHIAGDGRQALGCHFTTWQHFHTDLDGCILHSLHARALFTRAFGILIKYPFRVVGVYAFGHTSHQGISRTDNRPGIRYQVQ